jgi:hypothetical protein
MRNCYKAEFIEYQHHTRVTSMDPRSLNCFVLGGRGDQVFTVKIPRNDNVSILKDLIKEKKAHDLDHVDASNLELWKVSLPVDTLTQELTVDNIKGAQQLCSVTKISSLFGEALDDELVHVLVQSPSGAVHPRFIDLS